MRLHVISKIVHGTRNKLWSKLFDEASEKLFDSRLSGMEKICENEKKDYQWLEKVEQTIQIKQSLREVLNQQKDIARLDLRLRQHNFRRVAMPGRGCGFIAVQHQLTRIFSDGHAFRVATSDWLLQNENTLLPNGCLLKEFVETNGMCWSQFCLQYREQSRWVDHLALIAIAQVYNLDILVITGIAGPYSDIHITPLFAEHAESPTPIYLGHLPEYNFVSLLSIRRSMSLLARLNVCSLRVGKIATDNLGSTP